MDEMKDLVVVVTGSGKGLGKGSAESCYAEGATVVTWDRSGAAKAVADTLDPSGKRTLYVQADAVKEEQVVRAFDEVVKRFGRVDVLVNNAGILGTSPTEGLAVHDWERTLSVDLTGPFICCKAVIPMMKARRYGKIINISSLAGESGGIMVGADYAAAKGGLLALTRKLALEVAAFDINVNAIAPGTTWTPMIEALPEANQAALLTKIPLRRFGMPEDVAYAACFLASDEASFITGATLDVNGGLLMR